MFNSLINKYQSFSVISRELIRIIFCLVGTSVLALILKLGLSSDGTIKPWAEKPIKLLSSPTLLQFSIDYLIWIFIIALAIALITGINIHNKWKLNAAANTVTGIFYCSGLTALLLTRYASSPETLSKLITYGLGSISLGLMLCYAFQMLIQGSTSPKML